MFQSCHIPVPGMSATVIIVLAVASCIKYCLAGLVIRRQPWEWLLLFVGYWTSQQHACAPQGLICSDKGTCCHTEIEVADRNFLSHPVTTCWHWANQSQHPSGKAATGVPILKSPERFDPEKSPQCKQELNPEPSPLEADTLTIRPMRQSSWEWHSWNQFLRQGTWTLLEANLPGVWHHRSCTSTHFAWSQYTHYTV